MVFTVVLMTILGASLFIIGLRRLIHGRYTLHPIVRVLLHSTLVLFLPLLSYVFSHTKGGQHELLLMVLWMLLIELIRKKVQAMVQPTDGSSFSRGIGRFTLMDYSDELARLVWIGYLIYSHLSVREGKLLDTMFVVLWSLGLVKLGQRVLNTWMAQDSFAAAKNAHLIAGYIQHVMLHDQAKNTGEGVANEFHSKTASVIMGTCMYTVMGEEKIVLTKKERKDKGGGDTPTKTKGGGDTSTVTEPRILTTPSGYNVGYFPHEPHINHGLLSIDLKKVKGLVTVSTIWDLARKDKVLFLKNARRQSLKNLCLSYALFKLLRRRFEHYPMVEIGSTMARELMLEGLLTLGDCLESSHDELSNILEKEKEEEEGLNIHLKSRSSHDQLPNNISEKEKEKEEQVLLKLNAKRAFQVLQLELNFLENYYQAVIPVVMSNPFLFVGNFILSLLFVAIYLLAVVAMSQNFDEIYCTNLGQGRLSTRDQLITISLGIILLTIEIIEFLSLYLFSNWLLVRLLCFYVRAANRWNKWLAHWIIVAAMWVKRRALRDGDACIKIQQVSILQLCDTIDTLWALTSQALAARVVGPQRSVMVSMEAKVAIVKALKGAVGPRSTGSISCPHVSGFIECGSITETILAWHLATDLLVFELENNVRVSDDQKVATMLARYCMYLVANMPELLVDDKAWATDVYQDMKDYIEKLPPQCCVMTGNTSRRRRMALMMAKNAGDIEEKTAKGGMEVFDELLKKRAREGDAAVWKSLADFWTEMLIFMGPSENVQGHAKSLATSGGELITYLWAFCTHAGISRQQEELRGQQV